MKRLDEGPPMPDAFRLIEKHRRFILAGTLLSLGLALSAAQWLPRKYKSSFVLTIHSRYFENPLIRDFLAPVHDSAEMRSQREALIRQALTVEFLDALGRRHGLYSAGGAPAPGNALTRARRRLKGWLRRLKPRPAGADAARLSLERELLLERIGVQRLNPDTFKVSFVHEDPGTTLRAATEIYGQVMTTLVASRRDILVHARAAIRKRMRSLASGVDPEPDAAPSARRWRLAEPIEDWSSALSGGGSGGWGPEQAANDMEIYKDLTRKMNYLHIALDSDKAFQGAYLATLERPLYPAGPIWPKRALFAVWGLAGGFLGTVLLCCLREFQDRAALDAAALARRTGIPLLGSLPVLPGGRQAPFGEPAWRR